MLWYLFSGILLIKCEQMYVWWRRNFSRLKKPEDQRYFFFFFFLAFFFTFLVNMIMLCIFLSRISQILKISAFNVQCTWFIYDTRNISSYTWLQSHPPMKTLWVVVFGSSMCIIYMHTYICVCLSRVNGPCIYFVKNIRHALQAL